MPGMLAAFKAHGTQRVLIAYGREDAGDRAADKLAPRLMAEGIECWRIQFVKQAGIELGEAEDVLKHDLGRLLLKLEAVQTEALKAAMTRDEKRPRLSEAEEAEALALLRPALARPHPVRLRCPRRGGRGDEQAGGLHAT